MNVFLQAPLAPDNLVIITVTRTPTLEETDVLIRYLEIWRKGLQPEASPGSPQE
jgi:hypothetical protein